MPLDIDNAHGELVRDPYRAKEVYKAWDRSLKGISADSERAIVRYLEDVRRGINIPPKARRGKRGYRRLITQRNRLKRTCELLAQHEGIQTIAPTTPESCRQLEQAVSRLFEKMDEGDIHKRSGGRFRSTGDHIKSFKAYWHWYMTMMKRERGVVVPDITEFLTVREQQKPRFVYFGDPGRTEVEEGFRRLFDHAKYDYRALIAFLFDSGLRSPSELVNVKRKDITPIKGTPYFMLNIRSETAKTFGRRIKLMLCHEQLRAHIDDGNFAPDDFLFPICPRVVNQYLKRLGQRALGKSGITMYDFRHNSVCYFLPRYKNQNALMYRFGWKKSDMIHYYSEFLGMRDTLEEDDFLVDVTKTQIEKELDTERRQRIELNGEVAMLRGTLDKLNALMNELTDDPSVVDALARRARQSKVFVEIAGPPK